MTHPYHRARKAVYVTVADMTADEIKVLVAGGFPAMRDWLIKYTGGWSAAMGDYLQACMRHRLADLSNHSLKGIGWTSRGADGGGGNKGGVGAGTRHMPMRKRSMAKKKKC